MNRKRRVGYLLLLLICGVSVLLWFSNHFSNDPSENATTFDRSLTPLIYTRHARCRMECRHIDEAEVQEILKGGAINFEKSEPNAKPDPKFAVEGITGDNQQVRIIFAPTRRGMVVITCIDLNQEWQCNCR